MGDTYDDSRASRGHRSVRIAPQLVIVLECDRPLAGGARYTLDGIDVVTIGRGADRGAVRRQEQDVRILGVRVPGRSVSAAHARLVRVGSTWALEDLDSLNGTFVNGVRVTRAVLRAGDLFEAGHVLMRVNPSLAMPEGAPLDVDTASQPNDGHVTLDPVLASDLERASQLTASGIPVILAGESGTGKEVLARWLHSRTRGSGRFVAVNCGAVPATLVESQLFGHVKGAFSGALRGELGFIRAADGGTLFLDEIADLPRSSQAALLRVLQEREVVPLGATHPIKVHLRLITATHQPLEELVERGEFRRDLFARIAGLVVTLPALRDRGDDLGVLMAALLAKIAPAKASNITFSSEVGRLLVAHSWPLNIRELERCIATCVTLAPGGHVEEAHLPRGVARKPRTVSRPVHEPDPQAERDEKLQMQLLEALSQHGGNIAATARELRKAPMQIHRWCKRFGIDPRPFRCDRR